MSDARITPYDIIFSAPAFEERFIAIRGQAPADAVSAGSLMQLTTAGELLRELLPADDEGAAHGTVFTQVSTLLFHAYTFWNEGRHVYRLNEPAFRALLAGRDTGAAVSVAPPVAAGYVQFPRNVLWARVDDDAAAEPVDGFFWSTAAQRLDVMLALGVRPGRPGISIIDLTLEDATTLTQWADVKARPEGADFENNLPGGELQLYHALTLHAEVLKLVALCFRRLADLSASPRDENGNAIIDVHG